MEEFVSIGPTPFSKSSVCAYRKGHSTTTALLTMKDITRTFKRGVATLAILADFSKAFDRSLIKLC